jgi:hypothetical protein
MNRLRINLFFIILNSLLLGGVQDAKGMLFKCFACTAEKSENNQITNPEYFYYLCAIICDSELSDEEKIETLKKANARGIKINTLDNDGRSLLHLAAFGNVTHKVFTFLITQCNVDPTLQDTDGKRAGDYLFVSYLHEIICDNLLSDKEKIEALQLAKTMGLDLKQPDSDGRTLLHWAAINDCVTQEIFTFLIDECKIDHTLRDIYGKTAWNYIDLEQLDDKACDIVKNIKAQNIELFSDGE